MTLFLVYHKIADIRGGEVFTVSPSALLTHLRIVRESGVPVVDPRTLGDGRDRHEAGVVFTFDDGTKDHFEVARPLLEKFAVRALFYVPTWRVDQAGHLTRDQIRRLSEGGHTIGSHSHSHCQLTRLADGIIAHELSLSARILADITGERPYHFAPPGGFSSRRVVQAARRERYRFVRTMTWGYNRRLDPMSIDIVPMTEVAGARFLEPALRGEGEWPLRLLYRVKNSMRKVCPHYGAFRSAVVQRILR